MKVVALIACLALSIAFGCSGCGNPASSPATPGPAPVKTAATAAPEPSARPPAAVSDADLAKAQVNEAGQVMILEYHNIRVGRTAYDRAPDAFRKDLDTLYREGYRPVAMHEFLDNHIDVPLGMTPVVLTFDDSSPTQFHYMKDGTLDPNCGFGILKAFHEAHPDFAMKGIFFMNASPGGRYSPVFGDQSAAAKKTAELLAAGMEVGNHTVTHPNLKKRTDAAVQKELADCVAGIHELAPNVVVDTFALPFGVFPMDHKLAESGESGGVRYHNRAIFLVGANPAPAPATAKFNPLALPRVQAYPGPSGSEIWLAYFRQHPSRRYRSDGDPATVTVPKSAEQKIDNAKLGAAKLRTY